VQQWLQDSCTQQQLVAAGYAPQMLQQLLKEGSVTGPQFENCRTIRAQAQHFTNYHLKQHLQYMEQHRCYYEQDAAQLLGSAQQLEAVGSAMCSFAVPCLCNNPACVNLCGLTELGLVSGRSCVCGGCSVARFCGRACQRAVWKQHKPVCAALAAAAAAPAAGVAVSPFADA
jgi:hypothetical protein